MDGVEVVNLNNIIKIHIKCGKGPAVNKLLYLTFVIMGFFRKRRKEVGMGIMGFCDTKKGRSIVRV